MLTAPLSLLRSSLTLGLLESIRTILLRLMDRPLPLKEAGTAEQEEDEEEDDRQAAKYGHQDLKGGSSSSSSSSSRGIHREMAVVLDMHKGMQSMQAEGGPLRNVTVNKKSFITRSIIL